MKVACDGILVRILAVVDAVKVMLLGFFHHSQFLVQLLVCDHADCKRDLLGNGHAVSRKGNDQINGFLLVLACKPVYRCTVAIDFEDIFLVCSYCNFLVDENSFIIFILDPRVSRQLDIACYVGGVQFVPCIEIRQAVRCIILVQNRLQFIFRRLGSLLALDSNVESLGECSKIADFFHVLIEITFVRLERSRKSNYAVFTRLCHRPFLRVDHGVISRLVDGNDRRIRRRPGHLGPDVPGGSTHALRQSQIRSYFILFQVGIFDRVPCKRVCFLLHLRFEIVSIPADGSTRFCRNGFCVSRFEYKDISRYRSAVVPPLIESTGFINDSSIVLDVIRITGRFHFYRYTVRCQIRVPLDLSEHQIGDFLILRKIRSENAGFLIEFFLDSIHLFLIRRIYCLRRFQRDLLGDIFVITARLISTCSFFISVCSDRIVVCFRFIQFVGAVFFRVYCDRLLVAPVIFLVIRHCDLSICDVFIIAVDRLECNVVFRDVLRHRNVDSLVT